MRKLILVIMLLIAGSSAATAQETNYFDSPFGGGIGYNPGWMLPSIEGLNSKLTSIGIPELGKNGMFTTGGSGYIYIGFVRNLRIGGMWSGGSTSQTVFNGGFNKEAIYTINTGAFSIEYTLPIIKDVGISVGALIGGGSQNLEVYQSRYPAGWDDIWKEFSATGGSTQDISRKFTNSFFLLSPTLNVDFPIYRFLSFRAGAGYLMKFGTAWTVDNDREVKNTPSDLSKNSFYIQTGIYIGFFSF